MEVTMSGSQTSERIRPGAVAKGRSPKVAVAGAARRLMVAGPKVLVSGFFPMLDHCEYASDPLVLKRQDAVRCSKTETAAAW